MSTTVFEDAHGVLVFVLVPAKHVLTEFLIETFFAPQLQKAGATNKLLRLRVTSPKGHGSEWSL